MIRVHGTCVDLGSAALLLRGPPGAGKSDLALRLIDRGARLVADDQVELRVRGEALWASAPPTLAGRLEVRGVGVLRLPRVRRAMLTLVVDLVEPWRVERLPAPAQCALEGVQLRYLRLAAFEHSTPAKLRAVARQLAPEAD